MLDNIQNDLNQGLRKMAESSLIKKLNEKEVDVNSIPKEKYEELVKFEMDIIKNDGKKVAAGIGIGLAISVLSGGLF